MAVTGWWNAGHGTWQRYYGKWNLTVRKQGTGLYRVTVADVDAKATAYEAPAGSLAHGKRLANEWVSNNGQ